MIKVKNTAGGASAEETKAPVYSDLNEANKAVAEQFELINSLTEDVQNLETENSELRAKAAGNTDSSNVIEHEGSYYKTNAGSYRTEDGSVIILDKNLLKAKQKVFGEEKVRIASEEDIAALIEEESNLISKIEK